MSHSIQEYIKRINSNLTALDCWSLLATTVCSLGLVSYLYFKYIQSAVPVSYIPSGSYEVNAPQIESHPFASSKGKTYTFSWCQNSGAITQKNRIYFETEEAAQKSGRFLSKLCQK